MSEVNVSTTVHSGSHIGKILGLGNTLGIITAMFALHWPHNVPPGDVDSAPVQFDIVQILCIAPSVAG